jgi:hypothetical protein
MTSDRHESIEHGFDHCRRDLPRKRDDKETTLLLMQQVDTVNFLHHVCQLVIHLLV